MPKLVDASARGALVFPAVCRIVSAEGVSAATVRRVAEESGLSPQALRGTWPSQERLHLRTVQWLAHKWQEDCWTWVTDDARSYVMTLLRRMVPLDDDARVRAQAWAAYARLAGDDSPLAEVVRRHDRERVLLLARALEDLQREHSPAPTQSRVILPEDVVKATPDLLEPEALHMLVLVRGLTALVCDHALPLSPVAAGEWLDAWLPLGDWAAPLGEWAALLGGRARRGPN